MALLDYSGTGPQTIVRRSDFIGTQHEEAPAASTVFPGMLLEDLRPAGRFNLTPSVGDETPGSSPKKDTHSAERLPGKIRTATPTTSSTTVY